MTRVDDRDLEVSPALGAVTDLIQEQVQPPTAAELNDGLRALFHRIERIQEAEGQGQSGDRRRGGSRGSWRRVLAAACGATVVAAAVAVLVVKTVGTSSLSPRAAELSYSVEGGSVVAGGYLRQVGRSGVKLSFNEGSQLALMPGARGRLLSVDRGGARMAVEQGTASFRITPSGHHLWLVDVGPFLVTVKGTVFTVSWDAGSERFELRLRRGRVAVSGPISGGDLELRAGQRVVVNLPRAETLITEDAGEEEATERSTSDGGPAAASSPAEAPAALPTVPPKTAGKSRQEKVTVPSALPAASTQALAAKLRRRGAAAGTGPTAGPSPGRPAAGTTEGARRWDQAMAGGDWDRILEDVERDGVTATLVGASDEELLALANAARYRRRMDLAREALAAERRRFPSSRRTLDATYLLGRVEEATMGGRARAVRWYDEYLSRAPAGTYASEALGRKMTLMNELNGASRARPLAEEYLRRFPGGSYAGSAQALMRAP
jgi:TolA-binding protein